MDDRSAMEKLERFAADVNARKRGIFGYPANCPVHLKDFYKWFTENEIYDAMINNSGDPFHSHELFLNALDFEREVIEFFAPFYGFDRDNLWVLGEQDTQEADSLRIRRCTLLEYAFGGSSKL